MADCFHLLEWIHCWNNGFEDFISCSQTCILYSIPLSAYFFCWMEREHRGLNVQYCGPDFKDWFHLKLEVHGNVVQWRGLVSDFYTWIHKIFQQWRGTRGRVDDDALYSKLSVFPQETAKEGWKRNNHLLPRTLLYEWLDWFMEDGWQLLF